MNSQYVKPINADKENRGYQDYCLRRGIIEKQRHEIKQCIQRIRPVDNPRKAYLFFSNFQIDGLKVDQKINCQDTELRNRLIRNDELGQRIEHLCQGSKYGQSFSKLNGNRISRDLKQSLEELELKESRLKIFRNWKYDNWMKIYSSDPDKHKNLEESIVQFF